MIVHSIQVLSAMTEMVMWCYWTGLAELEGPYGGLCLPAFLGHHCAVSFTTYIIDTFNHYCWIFLQNYVKIDAVLQKSVGKTEKFFKILGTYLILLKVNWTHSENGWLFRMFDIDSMYLSLQDCYISYLKALVSWFKY